MAACVVATPGGDVVPLSLPGLRVVQWLPPKSGWVKLNFDGGYSREKKCATRGGIFRNNDGSVCFAFADLLLGGTCYDGEAMALSRGLELAHTLGIKKIWVEGDAKFFIEAVLDRRRVHPYNKNVVESIKCLLAKFEAFEVTFLYREGNEAANALVHYVRRGPPCNMWNASNLPTNVARIVDQERNGHSYLRIYRNSN